jgi:hypothetical protein
MVGIKGSKEETFEEFLIRLDSGFSNLQREANKLSDIPLTEYCVKAVKFVFYFIMLFPLFIIYLGMRRSRK